MVTKKEFLGRVLWRVRLKAKVPSLVKELRAAKTAQELATVIQSAWTGYGEGEVSGNEEVASLAIKNKVATFNSAMSYLGFRFTKSVGGATVYKLFNLPFVVETTVSGETIHVTVKRATLASAEKHQPGKHSQQTHAGDRGSSGSGGIERVNASDAIAWARKADAHLSYAGQTYPAAKMRALLKDAATRYFGVHSNEDRSRLGSITRLGDTDEFEFKPDIH
jgi:hypothetical protein